MTAIPENTHPPQGTPTLSTVSFEAFRADALAKGFDEVVERRWAADVVNTPHTHPFGVQAVVMQGEMWLHLETTTLHLLPGDGFTLAAGVPHHERYGAEGATSWVARHKAS